MEDRIRSRVSGKTRLGGPDKFFLFALADVSSGRKAMRVCKEDPLPGHSCNNRVAVIERNAREKAAVQKSPLGTTYLPSLVDT